MKLSGTYRKSMNCIYSSIFFFLFYFFEVLLTILKNGFRNRAAFVSLQFVGFQPSFQVLGAALPKYGESSVIQQSKSFLLSSNLSKMRKLLLSSELYNWTLLTDPRQSNFLSLNFDILDFDFRSDRPQPVRYDLGQWCVQEDHGDQGEVKSNSWHFTPFKAFTQFRIFCILSLCPICLQSKILNGK